MHICALSAWVQTDGESVGFGYVSDAFSRLLQRHQLLWRDDRHVGSAADAAAAAIVVWRGNNGAGWAGEMDGVVSVSGQAARRARRARRARIYTR